MTSMQICLARERAGKERDTERKGQQMEEGEEKRAGTYLSENGTVHDGWGGRRLRMSGGLLGKLGTTKSSWTCHVTGGGS